MAVAARRARACGPSTTPTDTIASYRPATRSAPEGTTVVHGPAGRDVERSRGADVLAADAGGAWLVVAPERRRPTRARPRSEPAAGTSRADLHVARPRAAWCRGRLRRRRGSSHRERRRSELLRIDPRHGPMSCAACEASRASAPINSVAAGLGYVWAVSASGARLYRIDPWTGGAKVQLASRAGPRPAAVPDARLRMGRHRGSSARERSNSRRSGICCTEDGREALRGLRLRLGRIHPPSGDS